MLIGTRSVCFCLFAFWALERSAPAVTITGGSGGLIVSVTAAGQYEVAIPKLGWNFAGSVGYPLANLSAASGADAVGNYAEVSFDFRSDAPRHGAIRSYSVQPAVLFSVSNSATAPNTFSFPNWRHYPQNLNHLAFSGIFAPPTFTNFPDDSPWVFFDSTAHTFILSPAANFMTASTSWGSNGELASGISPQISTLPAGFHHQTLLVVEAGINRAFERWGGMLTALGGKRRPANDADLSLNRLGYWTDNGASYYYHAADSLSYEETLAAVKSNFDQLGIPPAYLQLDSWFYPKGVNAAWNDGGGGIYQYTAATPPFNTSLSSFQQSLGVSLITHARWIDPASPYHQLYKMSGNVVLDPGYWNAVAGYLASSGVVTYEQDWLGDKAHADFNLADSEVFLDNMAAAMARRNLTVQYCMATPRHFLQSSHYSNVTTIRTSEDRLARYRWTNFLYTSRLASALGVWPFSDVFMSTEPDNLLLATLSAGPVGIGDPIGAISRSNLLRAVRLDGVIVKPDQPLTPLDSSYLRTAQGRDFPQIASTYSDFGTLRAYYIFAYAEGLSTHVEFSPSDFSLDRPAYLYDYFSGSGRVVNPQDVLTAEIGNNPVYWVATPIGPSGIALIGDTDQFVPMGKKRIAAFSDDGAVQVTVSFAGGEISRTIKGYSVTAPAASASHGTVGPVIYNRLSRLFTVEVKSGPDGTASIRLLRPRRRAWYSALPGNGPSQ